MEESAIKLEPDDGVHSVHVPHAAEEVEVQILTDINDIIHEEHPNMNHCGSSSSKKNLETSVNQLFAKVRELEGQIAACLQILPLMHQVFNKCNQLEQKVKLMQQHRDGKDHSSTMDDDRINGSGHKQGRGSGNEDDQHDLKNLVAIKKTKLSPASVATAQEDDSDSDFEPAQDDDHDSDWESQSPGKNYQRPTQSESEHGEEDSFHSDDDELSTTASSSNQCVRQCETCHQTFTKIEALHFHRFCHRMGLRDNRTPKHSIMTCQEPNCNFSTGQRTLFYSHYQRVHTKVAKPFHCKVCNPTAGSWFYDEQGLARHYTSIHPITNDIESNKDADQGSQHQETRRGRMGRPRKELKPTPVAERTCAHCSRVFANLKSMNRHIQELHSDVPPIPCGLDNCQMSSIRLIAVQKHQLRAHGRISQHVQEKITARENRLVAGVRNPCPKGCGRTFIIPGYLKDHAVTCTGDPNPKRHQCDEYGARFIKNAHLQSHKRCVHQGDRGPHVICAQCGLSIRASWLKRHERTHEPPGTQSAVTCATCGLAFKRGADLRKHERTHTNERPFPCPTCDLTFKDASTRRRHMYLHEGKPAQCDQCEKRFTRKFQLKSHQICHSKGTAHTKPRGSGGKNPKDQRQKLSRGHQKCF